MRKAKQQKSEHIILRVRERVENGMKYKKRKTNTTNFEWVELVVQQQLLLTF